MVRTTLGDNRTLCRPLLALLCGDLLAWFPITPVETSGERFSLANPPPPIFFFSQRAASVYFPPPAAENGVR